MYVNHVANRRANKRWPCSWKGSYVYPQPSDDIKVRDVSSQGAKIFSWRLPVPNSYIKIAATTAWGMNLDLEGRVCWCRKVVDGFMAGICFNRTLPFNLERMV
jgi:hypothetical protein